MPLVGPTVSDLWNTWAADLSAMVSSSAVFLAGGGVGLSLLLGLANGVLGFVLALIVAFFFYAAGDRFAAVLTALPRPHRRVARRRD